ncbi:MAG: hypothetical protein LW686_01015 [Ilumatobacteraceae bacterium]|nr:hypothetical protein [Ilumatobacteraceae bacterium]
MADWMNDGFAIQADSPDEMVYPPRVLFGIAAVVVVASIVQLVPSFDHLFGYITALVGASLGGVVAVIDQKRRANSNYINFNWFSMSLKAIRYFALAAAAGNIAYLAIDAWQGKGII